MSGSEKEGIDVSESPSTVVDDFVEINPINDASPEANAEEVKDNSYAKESAKDTVARILKESTAKNEVGSEDPNQTQSKTVTNKNQVGLDKKEELAEGIDPELLPPERLNSQQRQLFQNLPVGLKRGLHKTIKDLERGQTQLLGQYKAQYEKATNDSRGLVEAINPYLVKWGDIGMTAKEVIVGLASAHDKLNNPETSESSFVQLGQQLGHLDAEGNFINSRGRFGSSGSTTTDIQNHPYVKSLEERINSLSTKIDPIYNKEEQQFQQTVSSITAEMQSVRDEINPATGNFVYPELQNEEYLKMLSPRISEIVASTPNISYADALRQANAKTREELFGVTTTQTQIRPTAPKLTFNNVRAIEAAQTVRGRISPSLNTQSTNGTPPPEALRDAKATTAWVIQEALRNQGR